MRVLHPTASLYCNQPASLAAYSESVVYRQFICAIAQPRRLLGISSNMRLYIGLIQERHDLTGGSRLVGLHYCLGGPESAQCALGRCAAPFDSVQTSRPDDPIWNSWE